MNRQEHAVCAQSDAVDQSQGRGSLTVLVGRQPIVDRKLAIVGYELLFRSVSGESVSAFDSAHMTSEVMLTAFTDIGLENLVGSHKAFINFPGTFLLEEMSVPFPSKQMVLEILEDQQVDDTLVQAVKRLAARGYTIALDDFVMRERWLPLLPLVQIVKVEVPALSERELERHVELLRPYGVRLLAEKVETEDEFIQLKAMGFDLFQGFFFAKPTVVVGKRPDTSRLSMLRLLSRLQDPSIDMDEISDLVSQDVALSYRLLRYVNSAIVGLPRQVSSIREALVYVGTQALRFWATLVLLAGLNDKSPELIHLALVRARTCELLGRARGHRDTSPYFTTGLFSILDTLMGMPMPQILGQLPLSDAVRTAILRQAGPLGEALHCALAFERCHWGEAKFAGLTHEEMQQASLDAVRWAFQACGEMAPEECG